MTCKSTILCYKILTLWEKNWNLGLETVSVLVIKPFTINFFDYSRKSRLRRLFLDLALYILIRTSLHVLIHTSFKSPSSHTQGILNSFSSHPHVTLKSSWSHPKVSLKSPSSHSQVTIKSLLSNPQVTPESSSSHPQVTPKSSLSHSQVTLKSPYKPSCDFK